MKIGIVGLGYRLGYLARIIKAARPEARFVAGPAARAIVGVCLPVDCGLSAGSVELVRSFAQPDAC